jgi:hypothetical protein
MKISPLIIWAILAVGAYYFLEPIFRKDRRDKTSLVLTFLMGNSTILYAALMLAFGWHDKDHSVLQTKCLSLTAGLAIGLAIALLIVKKGTKPPVV